MLSKVKHCTQSRWPETQDVDLKPFHNRRNKLSLEDNVLLCGNRVIIPSCFQARVPEMLHSTHMAGYIMHEGLGSPVHVRGCLK